MSLEQPKCFSCKQTLSQVVKLVFCEGIYICDESITIFHKWYEDPRNVNSERPPRRCSFCRPRWFDWILRNPPDICPDCIALAAEIMHECPVPAKDDWIMSDSLLEKVRERWWKPRKGRHYLESQPEVGCIVNPGMTGTFLDLTPPWVKFPSTYVGGWNQGAPGDWMSYIWPPFWKKLTPEERAIYVEHWPPPLDTRDDWIYYLTERCPKSIIELDSDDILREFGGDIPEAQKARHAASVIYDQSKRDFKAGVISRHPWVENKYNLNNIVQESYQGRIFVSIYRRRHSVSYYSNPDFRRKFMEINGAMVCEAVTRNFTKMLFRVEGEETQLAEALARRVGDGALRKAYFAGDADAMRKCEAALTPSEENSMEEPINTAEQLDQIIKAYKGTKPKIREKHIIEFYSQWLDNLKSKMQGMPEDIRSEVIAATIRDKALKLAGLSPGYRPKIFPVDKLILPLDPIDRRSFRKAKQVLAGQPLTQSQQAEAQADNEQLQRIVGGLAELDYRTGDLSIFISEMQLDLIFAMENGRGPMSLRLGDIA